jgi:Leucine-rich repeat (LRR) protein
MFSIHFAGEIPTSVYTLPVLHDLDLSGNQLYGPIRGFDKIPSQLVSLYLSENNLSGPIPKTIF